MFKRITLLAAAAAVAAVIPAAGSVSAASAGPAASGRTISTVAGGVGGPGRATAVTLRGGLSSVCGVSYGVGRVLVGNVYSVREVNPQSDALTTVAGTGSEGPVGDGGPATVASFPNGGACGTVTDAHGNLVIATYTGQQVQVVAHDSGTFYGQAMTAGDIYSVAGTGHGGFTGDGGLATAARLLYPRDVTVDSHGNLVIADAGNDRIRVVAASAGTFYGRSMIAGHIYTVAGNGDPTYSGDGIPATQAAVSFPEGVITDAAGNLVIADTDDSRVRVVAAGSGTFYGQAMTAGHIYTVAGNGHVGFSGDGGPATAAALHLPDGVAADGAGNLVIADTGNYRARVVAAKTGTFYGQAMTAGHIYTVAGDGTSGLAGNGGPATAAELSAVAGVAFDGHGNLLVAGTSWVQAVAAQSGSYYGQAMTAGHIYAIAGTGDRPDSGVAGGLATRAEFSYPEALAVDGAGNVLTSVSSNIVLMVPAAAGTFYGQAMTAGHIYTVAGDGRRGFSGDGGLATKASLYTPSGVSVDHAGNLVIADTGNYRVRVVAAKTGTFYGQAMTAGHIYTVAGTGVCGLSGDGGPAAQAELCVPWGLTVDAAGNLVISEIADIDTRVQVVAAKTGTFYGQAMTAGHIYAVAGAGPYGFSGDGGPATAARFLGPNGVAVDATGNLVIADSGNGRIRVVAASTGRFYGQAMTAGDVYTVAGGGTGSSGDGGPATAASMSFPAGVAVDQSGNLVIADEFHSRIRVVATSTGRFYGRAMTAGDIYSVAGSGAAGFSGDGGPAISAELRYPQDVAVAPGGALVIVDDIRVREVSG